jgi:heme a synthase
MTISPSTYRRIAAATVASLVFIMVTGAAVRLTGSGLGCPSWPNCEEGSLAPRDASDAAGMVEFGNRLVTGVVMLFTAAAVLGARRRRPQRRDLYRWAWGLPAWVMGNAIVGAMVVWFHLTPISVMGHFLLSLGALWNALVLYERSTAPDAEPGQAIERRARAVPVVVRGSNLLLVAAGAALVTGTLVTGSGPHAGDEEDAADRLGFDISHITRIHGIAVIAFLALTLAVLWRAGKGDTDHEVQRRLRLLVTVIVAQATVGYVQYFNDVPALLVGLHVLGAATVWLAVVWVRLGVTESATGTAPGPSPAEPPQPVATISHRANAGS